MAKQKRSPRIQEPIQKIGICVAKDKYRLTKHAIEQQIEREIDLPDVLYVLKNGYHEAAKTTFDDSFNTYKYAIRGKTIDQVELRIIVSFQEDEMLIITVMYREDL